ncbi:MAG: hypothetical protein ACPL3C_01355 [Pyrobaculum sp.]|uniref:hypothetical protein n=1 Tax=Pyrobaculum sp. TaxID=2004705 RepID=UPI003CBAA9A8
MRVRPLGHVYEHSHKVYYAKREIYVKGSVGPLSLALTEREEISVSYIDRYEEVEEMEVSEAKLGLTVFTSVSVRNELELHLDLSHIGEESEPISQLTIRISTPFV